VKYSEYEWREKDGVLYIKPAPGAKPQIYNPLKDADAMVLDALNVGMLQMNRSGAEEIKAAAWDFVCKYGLLGFMSALPTTPHFTDFEAAYLPTNHFIKKESMPVAEYVDLYFPFEKLDFWKNGKESGWNVNPDTTMTALAMTFGRSPMALNMSFQREYSERYDWMLTQFKDWAFTYCSSFLYYEDYDRLDDTTRNLYREGMAAFGGIAPTYHILLLDKPTIVWDFYSLLLCVQMMFSFALTDETKPLRTCKHCTKIFMAGHPNAAFCSHQCKNQFNVYKSRGKK
jgi:hypothetical protein